MSARAPQGGERAGSAELVAALSLATTSRWLAWRPLRRIGEVSYGMYLLHPLCLVALSIAFGVLETDIMTLTGWPLTDAVLGLMLASAAVYIVAAICYRVYEMPFLRLKRYFEHQRSAGAGHMDRDAAVLASSSQVSSLSIR